MTKKSEPIVFFGSGPVAAESLSLLVQDFAIEAVITKPRPLHHRGDVPVIRTAEELGLPIYTAINRGELDQCIEEHHFGSRLGILIDFGIIVSQSVIDYFPLGIVNSHFSLLPEWRGADPITFSILSGQKQTGVSLMLLTAGMDEGPILAYAPYNLSPQITTPELTHDLVELSYKQLSVVIPEYFAGHITPRPQDPTREPTYSRKLSKEDGVLDWRKPAEQLEREIRAFIEWPKSHATLGNIPVVVTGAHIAHTKGTSGAITIIDKKPAIYCGKQTLVIDTLKPAGKQEMTGEAFLAGYKRALNII
ncbi:MAG TPA: methionyl-tRNA formyltransferase [Candidatus Saccharimonadales bacterium]|jgi:methionyl-tRNA formyltransferase|nr:methionyl-tRNA formyltransferase [Candidatus Saccharimonadales bacterium]